MPITTSAKKALRSSKHKRGFNIVKKELINKAIRQVKKLISEKKFKEAKDFFPQVQKILDKSVKTGLLKKNTASRKKSRISAMIKKAA
ncbi:MAG: 30S ribosomal protein S20 [Parcubacteria group bacterium GW2011_GWF2_39_8b]|uniref:Small ribosomal subunit protein bS20 n=2 Tax=Candidatus Zambryskiibacteriota TaxID=1817925 RepID=A0A1G2T9H3_9BACT|nr:MAG: 30S ribosomal protein S20 [Parcubacteria group bacterium GW2011_GWF2_39_8b]KKR45797.1 MAG: 30S ribosomal protein S20 [Parcubacteria group bacterium GW2011_GWA2_40_14]OHA93913.1 MAG: hypothetical protein A2W58_03045 [Candidatus Zambryskibacteria bacterium RIFCSPHIGHO2_02_38_10.5]OHA97584.1 MAG: hypothetical protein A3C63_02325 [Candidatus Zambryskibacteria bacterium RIFCSPHIGHO2_02_FULL_39_82]OHB09108.1 MAG: hypothetical protein A2W64_02305 [Candidatus Zambryskibacteria bacterium RIFCSPL